MKGDGGQIDYGMRVYDPRVGRFLSVDPLMQKYPWYTPYQFAGNTPLQALDLDGLEPVRSNEQQAKEDKALQERMEADDIKYNTPREGLYGHFYDLHSATPAEEDFHPVRAHVKNFFFYSAKYLTPLLVVDNLVNTYQDPNASAGDKIQATAETIPVLLTPDGEPFEAPLPQVPKVKAPVQAYEVGTTKDLWNRSVKGDNLDVHHTVQGQPGSQLIPDYDYNNAPGIVLPKSEHKMMPTLRGTNTAGSARAQLAKDIFDLRRNTNAPNTALQQLIELNKTMFPDSFKKSGL